MDQERHYEHSGKDFFEDFRVLRNSDLWPCLPQKTQQGILTLLGEDLSKDIRDIEDTQQ